MKTMGSEGRKTTVATYCAARGITKAELLAQVKAGTVRLCRGDLVQAWIAEFGAADWAASAVQLGEQTYHGVWLR